MSVSDPLIRDFKGWTRKLIESNEEITDDNPHLLSFCGSLEKCFQQGLIAPVNSIGFAKIQEAWYWLEEVGQRHGKNLFTFTSVIDSVSNNAKVQSEIGKFRLLIRTCLVKRCLYMPVQLLVRIPGVAAEYYQSNSILGDEILGEIFLSVLLQISRLKFQLNLRNARFLDESWQLPLLRSLELVPCRKLGVSVYFIKRKALIISVEENSVAAEDDKVQVGDVLDEINDIVLVGGGKGTLARIMRKFIGLPITLHIIKYHFASSDDLYGPIVNLFCLSELPCLKNLMPVKLGKNKIVKKSGEMRMSNDAASMSTGYAVTYCGSITTNNQGDVKQIEQAIWRLLRSRDVKSIPVRFECLEMGIRITQEFDNAIILKQSYMEISSCGRTANIPAYFAFIAGNTTCNISTTFDAYVFHHRNESEVQIILQSLGQGFHRTHFAV